MKDPSILGVVILLFVGVTTAPAAFITLQSVADNTLYDDPAGALSNGQGPTFFSGNTGGNLTRRGLIKFGTASVPAGAIVDSVSLRLFLYQAQGTQVSIDLHRVLQAWGEGTSATGFRGGGGANATTGDATWLHTFYGTSLWNTPGGDFVPTVSATTLVAADTAYYTWSSTPGLVADVQGWLDNPASNFGWLLEGDETQSGTAKAFATREISTLAQQPALSVSYHLAAVPEPATACTGLALGLVVLGRALARRRTPPSPQPRAR